MLKPNKAILDHFYRRNRSWNNLFRNNLFQNNLFQNNNSFWIKIDYNLYYISRQNWNNLFKNRLSGVEFESDIMTGACFTPFSRAKIMFRKVWFQKMIQVRDDCITTGYYCNLFIHIQFQNTIISPSMRWYFHNNMLAQEFRTTILTAYLNACFLYWNRIQMWFKSRGSLVRPDRIPNEFINASILVFELKLSFFFVLRLLIIIILILLYSQQKLFTMNKYDRLIYNLHRLER